jgi:hypothetical protein
MIFLRDEVQTPSIFFVHHFVPLLTRLRIFLDQLQLALPPRGGVSSSTVCSVAVIEVHKPKLLSFGLNFTPATYQRTDFRRPVQDSICFCLLPHKYVHDVCVLANVVYCGIHLARPRPPGKELARAGEKRPGNTRRPHKTSTAQQLAATIAWSRGLY